MSRPASVASLTGALVALCVNGCYLSHERAAPDGSAPDAGRDAGTDAAHVPFDPSRLSLCRVIERRALVAISPDGMHAAMEGDTSIEIVGTRTGAYERQMLVLRDAGTPSPVVGFTTDSQSLVVRESNVIAVYDLATGARTTTPIVSASVPAAAAIVPEGVILVVDDTVEALPFGGAPRVIGHVDPFEAVYEVHVLPSGELLLVGRQNMFTFALDDGHEIARASFAQSQGAFVLGADVIAVSTVGGTAWFDAPSLRRLSGSTFDPIGPGTATHYLGSDGGLYAWVRSGDSVEVMQLGVPVGALGLRLELAASPTVLGVSTDSDAFAFVADDDGHVLSQRDANWRPAIAFDGALLTEHRFVADDGVFDLDAEQPLVQSALGADVVLGTADARLAFLLRRADARLDVLDESLAVTSLTTAPEVQQMQVAPDGTTVVTLGAQIERIDVATGARNAIDRPLDAETLLAVAPGGARAYVATSSSGVLEVDLTSGTTMPIGIDARIGAMAQSQDGRWLAASTTDSGAVLDRSPLVLFDTTSAIAAPAMTTFGAGVFTDEGRWLLWTDATSLQASRTASASPAVTIAPDPLPATMFASPDGEVVVLAYSDDMHVYCLPESSLHP